MAPVILVGLARWEFQRHVGIGTLRPDSSRQRRTKPSHGVVATLVTPSLKLLEQDLRRTSVLFGLLGVVLQLLDDQSVNPSIFGMGWTVR